MTDYKILAMGYDGKWQEITVRLEINYAELAKELGQKAFRNKTKKAHEVGGLVKCKVISYKVTT